MAKSKLTGVEKEALQSPGAAYMYAADVIGGRWPQGEKVIATSAEWSFLYARFVLGGRFQMGETAIAKDEDFQERYESMVLNNGKLEGKSCKELIWGAISPKEKICQRSYPGSP